jgi:ketosteroid isomerase-like protein
MVSGGRRVQAPDSRVDHDANPDKLLGARPAPFRSGHSGPMSQDNVERLRRGYEVFNATSEVDPELWAPDVECIQIAEAGAAETVFYGPEGLARAVRDMTEVFADFRLDPERFFDLGDRILVFVRLRGRARESGVPIDVPYTHVATFRGSQITRWQAYSRRRDALEAEGLREAPLSTDETRLSDHPAQPPAHRRPGRPEEPA